ncbi:MAG TPA: serine/threonine-protein kinase [Candidatus Polarisedimenticolaceae bacterium]
MRQDWSRLWPRIEPVLDAVLELPEGERAARVRELCAGDPVLLEAALALVDADRDSGSFLETPPELGVDPDETIAEAAGPDRELSRVGPFRIVRELGRGGMGTVLLGERDDGHFEQSVAIKVLHPGLAVGAARETLVRERRILAQLEHPRIARMFDGGVTETGEPYFVMENVEGLPLDAYCDERRLAPRERLRLFLEVCRAVEYAHGRFVVHCDIKPRNILVTPAGEVKLLDFGIAQRLEEERANRADGVRFFTPAWAAPEQATGGTITAATDVYQLGLILRELVPAPLPGNELRAIVDRAVRPEPAERYPTAEALRRDVEALLEDRPVAAFGSSLPYRARKYVRRHRFAVAAAVAVGLSLAGGFLAVARERDRATLAERRAVAVNDFVLHELLRAPMPEVALGHEPTVAEVLAAAARSVDHAFEGQPEVEAEVRLTLAETYASLGRSRDAREQADAARVLLAGSAAPPALRDRAERMVAGVAIDEGRLDEARAALEALLGREREALGPSHPETLETAAELGRALRVAGELARAEAVLRDAASAVPRDRPETWRVLVTIESLLAETLTLQSRGVEAASIARSVLDTVDRNLGPDHPERIRALLLQANALTSLYRYAEAAAATALALDSSRRIYGDDHPATADALTWHALAQERLGRYDVALAAVTESLAIRERALGADHPRTVLGRYQLGVLTANADRREEAVPIFREVVERRAATLGEAHPDTLRAMKSLYLALDALGRREETIAVVDRMTRAYEAATAAPDADPERIDQFADHLMGLLPKDRRDPSRALPLAERAVAASGRARFGMLRTLADAQEATGRPDLAITTMEEALRLSDGLRSWSTTEAVLRLLRGQGRDGEAEAFLRGHRDRQLRAPSPDERMVAKTERLLALELQRTGRLEEAERVFAQAHERLARVVPGDNWELGRIQSERGGCLLDLGRRGDAEPLLVEGLAILEKDRMARDATAQARARLERLREPRKER